MSNLQGTIPYDFVNVRKLEHLDLHGNEKITGQLRCCFGNLCKLKTLDLLGNNFSGNIDGVLGNFSTGLHNNLESLALHSNKLIGKILDSLGIFGSLRQLSLGYKFFGGSIPASIGKLSSLQLLHLSYKEMNGTIPKSIGKLLELVTLLLDNNSWEGVITEAHLMNLTRLEDFILNIEKNQSLVVFNVAYEWVPPFTLKELQLESNVVGPRFPIWLQVQSELKFVNLRNTGISDNILEEWSLRYLLNSITWIYPTIK